MNRADAQAQEERITRDSPRTVAPEVGRPWLIRAGFLLVVAAIVVVVLLVVGFGVGGERDAASNPADTPAEVQDLTTPAQPAP